MTADLELCIGAAEHRPMVLWTERHHVYPMYLCRLAGVPIRQRVEPLCGTCHENVHHAIHHLLADGTVGGHHLSAGSRALVYDWWAWWQDVISA